MSELAAATYSVLSAVRTGKLDAIEGIDPTWVYGSEARQVVTLALALDPATVNGDAVAAIAEKLPGGLAQFNQILAAAEKAARVETGGDIFIPAVRAVDVIRFEAVKRRRRALVGAMLNACKTGATEEYQQGLQALSDFEDTVSLGGKNASFFRPADSFPDDMPEPEELVRGIIPRASLGFIAGPPKAGRKTTLAASLLVEVARGGQWLGHDIAAPGKALLLAAEESEAATLRRIRAIIKGLMLHADDESRILSNIVIGCSPTWTLDGPEGQGALIAAVKTHQPMLVLLDPLTRITLADENDRTAVEPLLSFLKRLALEHQIAISVIHHSNKLGSGVPTPENMLRGSSALRGAHDWLACSSLQPEGGNRVYFELRYHDSFSLDVEVKFSNSLGTIEIDSYFTRSAPTTAEAGADLACTVERILIASPGGITRNGVVRCAKRHLGKEPKAAAVQSVLETLARYGKAKVGPGQVTRSDGRTRTEKNLWHWTGERQVQASLDFQKGGDFPPEEGY